MIRLALTDFARRCCATARAAVRHVAQHPATDILVWLSLAATCGVIGGFYVVRLLAPVVATG